MSIAAIMNRQGLAASALLAASLLAPIADRAAAQEDAATAAASIEAIREGYDQYFELKKLISKERGDWQLEKEILEDRIAMIVDQIEDLKEKTAEEESKITEADNERVELQDQLEELTRVERTQLETVRALEARVKGMLPALPETLRDKVQPLATRLPEEETKEEDIKLSISQRFGNVLGILNEVNKFHGDIAVVNERRALDGGTQAEVETMYLGVSSGYFAGSGDTADEAGIGTPTPDGYQWERRPDIADDIYRAIRIYQNEEVAAFVPLPATVTDRPPDPAPTAQ